ncbi:acetyl-CoA C-acetyltransferase [soil metagenome]
MKTITPVLLDGVRTPFGRFRGALREVDTRDLLATAISALVERQPALSTCDGVLLGQVLQAGHGQNPARLAAAAADIPWTVPAATLNNVCLAGLATASDASRRIQLGEGKAYIVGGGDSMSRAAHAAVLRGGVKQGSAELVDTMIVDGLQDGLTGEGMGELSERANRALGITRAAQDAIAVRSHQCAAAATDEGRLDEEIVETDGLKVDEGIRPSSSPEALAGLPPAFGRDGTITAGNASQMSDGATVGAVTSLDEADHMGVAPLVTLMASAEVAGPDNTLHLKPAAAIRAVCERGGIGLSELDLIEINEAFAGVVAASVDDLGVPLDIVNVNGGAIALGHPLGGTGLRLLLTLARELSRRQGRYGVAALCGGGGQGLAVLVKRIGS